MTDEPSRISCSIDLHQDGHNVGYLAVTHSNNQHAYGLIPIPIAVIRNGDGPTALITAGNHGDEYEGAIIARRLIQALSANDISGRLIVIPALNYPAVLADARVSPLDDGNMNRAYPGSASASPTFAIAHYVESVLLPQCDAALDLHSGGKASEFMPCAFLVHAGSAEFMAAKLAAVQAFAAPTTTVVGATSDKRSLSAAADRHGVVNMATELAGGGTVTLDALTIGWDGTRRWLAHIGLLRTDVPQTDPTRLLRVHDRNDFVMATIDGIFEPSVCLGDDVQRGDVAGTLHPVDDPVRDAVTLRFNASGTVICRRVPARAVRGDYLFHLGHEVGPQSLVADS